MGLWHEDKFCPELTRAIVTGVFERHCQYLLPLSLTEGTNPVACVSVHFKHTHLEALKQALLRVLMGLAPTRDLPRQ